MKITEVKNASSERVNHPSHYAAHYRREVIELTGHFDFTTGNALKYVLRCRFKERPAEDLQKARWYLNYFADHPETGFVREEGLEPVLADFRADLGDARSGEFGPEAARFMDRITAAVRAAADAGLRSSALLEASEALDRMLSGAAQSL